MWLSVLIKQNQQVIRPRTVAKCSWEDTFEMMPGKSKMQAEITVEKGNMHLWMHIHSAYIDAPVSLTEQFKCSYACLSLERDYVSQSSGTEQYRGMRNAAEGLMASSHKLFFLLH